MPVLTADIQDTTDARRGGSNSGWDSLLHASQERQSIHDTTRLLIEKSAGLVAGNIHHFKEWWDEFQHEFTVGFIEMTEDLQDFSDLILRSMEDPEQIERPFVAGSTKTVLQSLPRLGPFRQYVDARQQVEIASKNDDRELLEFAREEYVAACLGLLGEIPSPISPLLFLIGIQHNLHTWMDSNHEYKDLVAAVADLAVQNHTVRHLVDRLLTWHESPEVKSWLAAVEREEDQQ